MINSRKLEDLHPTLFRGANELVKRMAQEGYGNVGFSLTYRCNYYQNYLYSQGRILSGQIITNAQGGESIHNYRLAFDIFKDVPDQTCSDVKFFDTAGRVWVEMGGVWGGSNVERVDKTHFEYTARLTIWQLKLGLTVPQNDKMLWELFRT